MSNQDTLEKVDAASTPSSLPRSRSGWRWQWLVAPLMGISVVLHLALLFVPIPTWDRSSEEVVEEAPPPAEEEEGPVDILSVSDIPVPEAPPEQPQQPQPEAPPPTGAVPPPPDPEQVPEDPIEEEFEDEPPIAEDDLGNQPLFDPGRQQALLGRTGGINVEFDETGEFPYNVSGLPNGPDDWPANKISCFFSQFDSANNIAELAPGGEVFKFFTRNYGLITNEDLPATFPDADIGQDPNGYCGESLYVVSENGTPIMFVSVVPVGVGGSNALVIFWTSDPRTA